MSDSHVSQDREQQFLAADGDDDGKAAGRVRGICTAGVSPARPLADAPAGSLRLH